MLLWIYWVEQRRWFSFVLGSTSKASSISILKVIFGPLAGGLSIAGILISLCAVALLTLATAIGGLVLWLAIGIANAFGAQSHWCRTIAITLSFAVLYGVATVWIVPIVAPAFGRVPLNCLARDDAPYAANSPLYCALNRHYVRPEMRTVLEGLAGHMAQQFPGTVTTYLDADFPFPLGLPLLPHLSHDDGGKLDVSLFYIDGRSGKARATAGAWPIGYWALSPVWPEPRRDPTCSDGGMLRWHMAFLQGRFDYLTLDAQRTSEMLDYLSDENLRAVDRIFIEPYLAKRLGSANMKVRFAGCHAARHDDHIHIEVRKPGNMP